MEKIIYKTCSFFGHRNATLTDEQYEKLKIIIEDLIVKKGVRCFLFGSKSDFDLVCHKIVTELKEKYPFIVRKCYTCKSEYCTLESERAQLEQIYSNLRNEKAILLGFEEEVEHKTKYNSGKASYVERNQAMIDDSDFCVFYYNENYKPNPRKLSRQSMSLYQPKSGTALAFHYAKQKGKIIINLMEQQNR